MAITKECECGCGRPAPIAVQSHTKNGYVKGQPIRYINGHNKKGKLCGETHPSWTETPTHSGIHRWLRDHHPKTGICETCGAEGKTHYASINGHVYTRDREDYAELCPSCHRKRDWAEGRHRPRGPDKQPRKKAARGSVQS